MISTSLSARIAQMNSPWNAPPTESSPASNNERFRGAMVLACSEFAAHALDLLRSWWPARDMVKAALDSRNSVHSSGQIMVLERACPWKEHLFDLETAAGCLGQLLYVLYPDQDGSWRIQAVPLSSESFESRQKLPSAWRGLRDAVLSKEATTPTPLPSLSSPPLILSSFLQSGVPESIFVHASGFIGGHRNREGALCLAVKVMNPPQSLVLSPSQCLPPSTGPPFQSLTIAL